MHFPITSTHRLLPLFALLTFSAPILALAKSTRSAPDDDLITLSPAPLTLDRVRVLYGEPSQRVGADAWIYWNFPTANLDAQHAGFDTLVVHFVGDSVRRIKLVRGSDLRALLRQLGQAKRVAAAPPVTAPSPT